MRDDMSKMMILRENDEQLNDIKMINSEEGV